MSQADTMKAAVWAIATLLAAIAFIRAVAARRDAQREQHEHDWCEHDLCEGEFYESFKKAD